MSILKRTSIGRTVIALLAASVFASTGWEAATAQDQTPPARMPATRPPAQVTKNLSHGAFPNPEIFLQGELQSFASVKEAVEEAVKINTTVYPEVPTPVRMSGTDINRLTCLGGAIKDVVYSREKGMNVTFSGKDAYAKYRVIKKGPKVTYMTDPTEIYIICDNQTYQLVAVPDRIPGQTIRLARGAGDRIKKNQSLLGGLPLEKKILSLVKQVYQNDLPKSFSVTLSAEKIDLFRDIDMTLVKTVHVEGEGIRLKEIRVKIRPESGIEYLDIDERDFLDVGVTQNTLAISVDKPQIKQGESARVFICEAAARESKGFIWHER